MKLCFRCWGLQYLMARPRDPSRKGGHGHVTIREAAELKSADLTRLLRSAIKQSKVLAASNKIPDIAPQSIAKAIYAKRRRPCGASR
jgi:hypothetical protein